MGYDRGDSFPFDFEPKSFPFGTKSNGKLSPRLYPIQFENKWKYCFLSAVATAEVPNITICIASFISFMMHPYYL